MPIDSFDPDSVWKPLGEFSQVEVTGALTKSGNS